ncbi:MAG: OmpA family protein [bacterium]|nr:OmpA family protein [bacterium]
MTATTRFALCALAFAVMLAVALPSAACAKCAGSDEKACEQQPAFRCKAKKIETCTEFKAAGDVWWGHTNRSFGNYIPFEKAAIPAKAVKKAAPPKFKPILFDLDKAVLRPDGIAIAKQVLAYMKKNAGKKVVIEGHCCDLAEDDYNVKLGKRRAEAVKRFLVKNGIKADRIATKTFGESKRVTKDEAKREINRRAVVVVCFK